MRYAAFVLSALVTLAPAARAATLTDPQTGLTVTAPNGYTLRGTDGVYVLQNSKMYARFILARSPYSLKKTVSSYIKAAKLRSVSQRKVGKSQEVTGLLRGKKVIVMFTPVQGFIDIITVGDRGKPRRRGPEDALFIPDYSADYSVDYSGEPRMERVTVGDVLRLRQILQSRRGGVTVPLQITIPMRRFTTTDGGATAIVPNLAGWTFGGGGGDINGFNPNQGAFTLGVPVLVATTGLGGPGNIVSPPVPPGQAIVSVWPQFVAQRSGLTVVVQNVVQVQGTDGWLGPNFLSGLYAVRLTLNGVPWMALFASGVFSVDSNLGWGWYHSYIAVPTQGPGGIGTALMNTWASWDNSVASNARLNQAIATILTTSVPGGPIDWKVFEKANQDWSDYIRGPSDD